MASCATWASLLPCPSSFRLTIFHFFYTTEDSEWGSFRIDYSSWCILSAAEVFLCDPLTDDGIFSREASVGTAVHSPKGKTTMWQPGWAEGRSQQGQGYEPLSCKNRRLRSPRLAANISPSSFAEMILKKDLKRAEGAKEECWNDIVSHLLAV